MQIMQLEVLLERIERFIFAHASKVLIPFNAQLTSERTCMAHTGWRIAAIVAFVNHK